LIRKDQPFSWGIEANNVSRSLKASFIEDYPFHEDQTLHIFLSPMALDVWLLQNHFS
jgi:hypothetical protein